MGGHRRVDIGGPSRSSSPLIRPPASPNGAMSHVTFDESRRICFSDGDLNSETDQGEITINSTDGGTYRYPESVSAFCFKYNSVKHFRRGECSSCGTALSNVFQDMSPPVGLPGGLIQRMRFQTKPSNSEDYG
jgi:hypothetical protein